MSVSNQLRISTNSITTLVIITFTLCAIPIINVQADTQAPQLLAGAAATSPAAFIFSIPPASSLSTSTTTTTTTTTTTPPPPITRNRTPQPIIQAQSTLPPQISATLSTITNISTMTTAQPVSLVPQMTPVANIFDVTANSSNRANVTTSTAANVSLTSTTTPMTSTTPAPTTSTTATPVTSDEFATFSTFLPPDLHHEFTSRPTSHLDLTNPDQVSGELQPSVETGEARHNNFDEISPGESSSTNNQQPSISPPESTPSPPSREAFTITVSSSTTMAPSTQSMEISFREPAGIIQSSTAAPLSEQQVTNINNTITSFANQTSQQQENQTSNQHSELAKKLRNERPSLQAQPANNDSISLPSPPPSTMLQRVQLLRPNQKPRFKCSNHTDCRNDGICNKGHCFCSPGFTGDSCDINIDECRLTVEPCSNNGTCIDDINTYRCECPPGFRGEHCQDLADMCIDSPCMNDAKCINHRTHFTCKCESGWEGQRCEINSNDCAQNPCQNNATCHDQIDSYRCECQSGFTGPNCEVNINDCAQNPCQNNATCHDQINDYECECLIGFSGKNCEENVDDCASSPCFHGQCTDLIGGFECDCYDGYTGKQCELDINECESNRPVCLNGGTCQNLEGTYQCHCREGYTGKKCSEVTDYCKAKQPCGKHGICKNNNLNPVQKNQFQKDQFTKIEPYQCECLSGYIGFKCERKRDCSNECNLLNANCINNVTCACHPGRREMCEYISSCEQFGGDLCLHGGICQNLDTGGYQCNCQEPYFGPICQYESERPQFDAFLLIIITCVGLLIAGCVVVSLVLFRSVRKARATRGTYSPSTQEKFGNSASDLLKLPVPERLI